MIATGEVALQAAHGLDAGLALGFLALQVGACPGVQAPAGVASRCANGSISPSREKSTGATASSEERALPAKAPTVVGKVAGKDRPVPQGMKRTPTSPRSSARRSSAGSGARSSARSATAAPNNCPSSQQSSPTSRSHRSSEPRRRRRSPRDECDDKPRSGLGLLGQPVFEHGAREADVAPDPQAGHPARTASISIQLKQSGAAAGGMTDRGAVLGQGTMAREGANAIGSVVPLERRPRGVGDAKI